MKILPIEKLTLVSNLSKSEVLEELSSNTRPTQSLSFGSPKVENAKLFHGTIYEDSFNIKRVIDYRNSFLPEVNGKVIEKTNGTEIEIELKPVSLVMAFMIIWLGGVSFAFITALIGAITGESPLQISLIPLGMLLIGFGMLKFGFSTETEKTKNNIIKILKAKVK
ncbi:hypothetical protein FCR2A7T_07340 [Flavobacterium cauense R2A-7]|uniref:Uncharacterized protein n=1 Tax=Flavobacterium cauense R2A-7 TaxID=1341154 RepID=V6S3Y2_9FLAO|nr:hypothetical protein [Flavobacterium cauense]ESU20962.1 hypothetical protein FCR2A7T_07340 [Flavobacterium cauense R2A-7]KGO79620.1 hypothetical protein Q762_14060 [Flavobacterium cauense R2A-7]TWI08367.1 hypothetical protein IP98_02787 [Flavobacterium cauense R2A-7]